MKLYMQQKIFSLRDRFYIRDRHGENRYYVEGELLSLGNKLHIFDMQGRELALVQQKLLTFLPKYVVSVQGKEVAEIVKELTLFRPSYVVNGPGWKVTGDFWDHDYEIKDGWNTIVRVSKEWFTWGDSYQLDIDDDVDPVLALAVVLAIDCVLDDQNNNAANN